MASETLKEKLHAQIEMLDDVQLSYLHEQLNDLLETDVPEAALIGIDRGLEDAKAGRMISLEEFKNRHPEWFGK